MDSLACHLAPRRSWNLWFWLTFDSFNLKDAEGCEYFTLESGTYVLLSPAKVQGSPVQVWIGWNMAPETLDMRSKKTWWRSKPRYWSKGQHQLAAACRCMKFSYWISLICPCDCLLTLTGSVAQAAKPGAGKKSAGPTVLQHPWAQEE